MPSRVAPGLRAGGAGIGSPLPHSPRRGVCASQVDPAVILCPRLSSCVTDEETEVPEGAELAVGPGLQRCFSATDSEQLCGSGQGFNLSVPSIVQ